MTFHFEDHQNETADKIEAIRQKLTQIRQSNQAMAEDVDAILDGILESYRTAEQDYNQAMEQADGQVNIEDYLPDYTGFIDTIFTALDTVDGLVRVMELADLNGTNESFFKLITLAVLNEKDEAGNAIDGFTEFRNLIKLCKGIIDTMPNNNLNMDDTTRTIINHDIGKHMMGLFNKMMYASWRVKKPDAAMVDSAITWVNEGVSEFSEESSAKRAFQNLHNYLNYVYLVLKSTNSEQTSAEEYARYAGFKFHPDALLEVTGDLSDTTQEAIAASLTLVLNAQSEITTLGRKINSGEGPDGLTELTDAQRTVGVKLQSGLEFEQGLDYLDGQGIEGDVIYYNRLDSSDISASDFSIFRVSNRATQEMVDGFGPVLDEYFKNPVFGGENNGLRIVMSLVKCDPALVDLHRKIGGIAVHIVKVDDSEMPYEISVTMLTASKSKINILPEEEMYRQMKEAQRSYIVRPDGQEVRFDDLDAKYGEGENGQE